MNPELVRAVIDQLADPAYAGIFDDALRKRAAANDSAEEPSAREAHAEQAEELFGQLTDAVTAELANGLVTV